MLIDKNEFFILEEKNQRVYITVLQKGYSLLSFNHLAAQYPRLKLSKFTELKMAINNPSEEAVDIGDWKPEVECWISADNMEASILLNCTEQELQAKPSYYSSQILSCLKDRSIVHGILMHVLQNDLEPGTNIVCAKGKPPVHGKDAVITYYKRSERKPLIREDGKADYYELSFLDEVKKGDWLGEKIPPVQGEPGMNLFGDYVMPDKGKNRKLRFDPASVGTFEEDGKIVLRALKDGVVESRSGRISVGDHLLIEGDVGVETGNIRFDGSVTIQGTICDNFSVFAEKDIQVNSELGISNIDQLESASGDIYVKGGIFGKGRSVVKAAGNIYVKHANECSLEAGGTIHIGYYSLGSFLRAGRVITDEKKGKLIGGVIEAHSTVKAAFIGNRMERKTVIHVKGFDRRKVKEELNEVLLEYKDQVLQMERLRRQLENYETVESALPEEHKKQYDILRAKHEWLISMIVQLDENRRRLSEMLETKGDGEVSIKEIAFPDTSLEIKKQRRNLNKAVKGTFYTEGNSIHLE